MRHEAEGDVWSLFRQMMTQGQDIALDYLEKGSEKMSARLDEAAQERVEQFKTRFDFQPKYQPQRASAHARMPND